jgi:lysyl-tRNA synthetase class 1
MVDFNNVTSWPFIEAKRIIERIGSTDKVPLFETGYGPSGLPHIGTFAEVARTCYVRRAYSELTGNPTRLIVFSDDMDALRKTPKNIPNQDMLNANIGMPLTRVPDPYGQYNSFAEHNNAMLCRFLDECGFEYDFASSTQYYKSGRFNQALKRMAECHDAIVKIVAPTLGEERRATWSPFMPIHPLTGHVMMVPILSVNSETGDIVWKDTNGDELKTSIYDGNCKIQWKADWALRWYALGVDYEMSGKDLIDSVKLSSKICKTLGQVPPINLTYELFLDEHGHKYSKSVGNGVSVEQWMQYGNLDSLEHLIFAKPQTAKKVFISGLPKVTDEYLANIERLKTQTEEEKRNNPAWFALGNRSLDELSSPVNMSMMLNLANVSDITEPDVLMRMVENHFGDMSDSQRKHAFDLATGSCEYYKDVIRPDKATREPTDIERDAILDLIQTLSKMDSGLTGEQYQFEVYEVGKRHEFGNLRDWFKGLYEVLLGQSDGPRFGHFIALYGKDETIKILEDAVKNEQRLTM